MEKIKIGEVFKLSNGKQLLSCMHCPNEFEYFAEFVKHSEEHLLQSKLLLPNKIKIEVGEENENGIAIVPEDVDLKPEPELVLFEAHFIDETAFNYVDTDRRISKKNAKNNKVTIADKGKARPSRQESNASTVFECFICHAPKRTLQSLQKHLKLHHRFRRFHCPHCEKSFAMKNEYDEHITKVHTNEELMQECYLCKKAFKAAVTLKSHMEMHWAQPTTCLACCVDFQGRANLLLHITKHTFKETDSKTCEHCAKKFSMKCELLEHSKIEHVKPVAPKKEHSAKKVKQSNEDLTNKLAGKRECPICKAMIRQKSFKKHTDIHATDSKAKCSVCNLTVRKRYLNTHMKTHVESDRVPCQKCDKTFLNKKQLTKHIKTLHYEKLNFQCDICSKAYGRSDKLLQHRRAHPEPMKYVCRFCNVGFLYEKSWQIHERYKHQPEGGQVDVNNDNSKEQCKNSFNENKTLDIYSICFLFSSNLLGFFDFAAVNK